MEEKRKYKRFTVDVLNLSGKMSLAEKVEILNISRGGISLKSDRRLSFGKEILLTLDDRVKSIHVKASVVRSELSGFETRPDGENVLVYTIAAMFSEGQADKVAVFIDSIEKKTEIEPPAFTDRREAVRFSITTPETKELLFPAEFTVKIIGLGGMLIIADQMLAVGSTVPMELCLSAGQCIAFTGKVASCRMTEDRNKAMYEIGVEFRELTEKDRNLVQSFINYIETSQKNR